MYFFIVLIPFYPSLTIPKTFKSFQFFVSVLKNCKQFIKIYVFYKNTRISICVTVKFFKGKTIFLTQSFSKLNLFKNKLS